MRLNDTLRRRRFKHGAAGASLVVQIGWVAAAVCLVIVAVLFAQIRSLRAESIQLRATAQEAERLAEENRGLERYKNQASEVERLRAETQEIHKLRNEVRQLRQENETLQAAAARPNPENALQIEVERLRGEIAALTQKLRGQEQLTQFQAATQSASLALGCKQNLRRLQNAIEQWALENKKPAGSHINPAEVALYLPEGVIPTCPSGAAYSITSVGEVPTCAVPGHEY